MIEEKENNSELNLLYLIIYRWVGLRFFKFLFSCFVEKISSWVGFVYKRRFSKCYIGRYFKVGKKKIDKVK